MSRVSIAWTSEEDSVLGTDTLVKVSARLHRPTSQIRKRMKELGVAPFGERVKKRSAARVAEEQAIANRNEARFEHRIRDGMAVAAAIGASRGGLTAAANELGISVETARKRLSKFVQSLRHPARLGETLPPTGSWRGIAPHILSDAVGRMSVELETRSRDGWRDPMPPTSNG